MAYSWLPRQRLTVLIVKSQCKHPICKPGQQHHNCSEGPITSQKPRGYQLQRGRAAQKEGPRPRVSRARKLGTGDRKLEKDVEGSGRGRRGQAIFIVVEKAARLPCLIMRPLNQGATLYD
jgi:hypothetical protein